MDESGRVSNIEPILYVHIGPLDGERVVRTIYVARIQSVLYGNVLFYGQVVVNTCHRIRHIKFLFDDNVRSNDRDCVHTFDVAGIHGIHYGDALC